MIMIIIIIIILIIITIEAILGPYTNDGQIRPGKSTGYNRRSRQAH